MSANSRYSLLCGVTSSYVECPCQHRLNQLQELCVVSVFEKSFVGLWVLSRRGRLPCEDYWLGCALGIICRGVQSVCSLPFALLCLGKGENTAGNLITVPHCCCFHRWWCVSSGGPVWCNDSAPSSELEFGVPSSARSICYSALRFLSRQLCITRFMFFRRGEMAYQRLCTHGLLLGDMSKFSI